MVEGTYEQALRGLFTIGTSSLASEKFGKGRWQTGIEILPSYTKRGIKHRIVLATSEAKN